MTRLKKLMAFGLFALVPIVAPGETPTCDTIYTGSGGDPTQWRDAMNWSPGIPRTGQVACIPVHFRELFANQLPDGTNVVYVDTKGGVAGEPIGACCIGSNCVETTPSDCETQGGHFNKGIGVCFGSICATGACCDADRECTDDNGIGGPMTESLCQQQGGRYLGAASCDTGDPCEFQQIPDGFEIIEIVPIALQPFENDVPHLSDCGELVFNTRFTLFDNSTTEVHKYDNGLLARLTDNSIPDLRPDINSDGAMTWGTACCGDYSGHMVSIYRNGTPTSLGAGGGARLNDLGQVAWYHITDPESCAFTSSIQSYDGEMTFIAFNDGLSNQLPALNGIDDIAWNHYNFPCGPCCSWTSDIVLASNGEALSLPSSDPQPQGADIDSVVRVAWSTGPNTMFEVYQNGETNGVNVGSGPTLNDRGDIAYRFKTTYTPYQQMLLHDGVTYHISSLADRENDIDNGDAIAMNEAGELAWHWRPNRSLIPSGIRYLRRIRTGDIDLDLDVDREDFARFPRCYTGPGDFDRLCECRFLDIDHDRDVDAGDYALFLANYTGPMEDCNDNGTLDLDDILFGQSSDCNRNGIPDECDLSSGSSPDKNEDGVPDDCVFDIPKPIWREIFPVWTNRFLTMIPRNEGEEVAIKVTLTSLHHPDPPYTAGTATDFSAFEGQVRWVGPPTQHVESASSGTPFWSAALQCTPHYQDWTGIDLLHVTGGAVAPSSEYHIQIVSVGCVGKEGACAWESDPVRIKTGRWGDVVEPFNPPSTTSQPDFGDIAALVNKFKSALGAPIKARALIAGTDINGVIDPTPDLNFTHIAACVDAFKGLPYPYQISSCP